MQDRFKFRVWDVQSQNYAFYDLTKEDKLNDWAYYAEATAPDYDEQIKYNENNCWALIIEQCTGLKDKRGKLIYEGDIVRAINQDTKDRPDLQIAHIWVDEYGCRWIKFAKEELSWNDFCSLIDYDGTLTIEIIGNIHENPELLEKSNE